jgi:transcriptional regulator with XRE-family HTH domain
MILSFEAVPELAACLEATFRADLCQRAAVEIVRLAQSYSQRKIEVALDLSQGYLSRLRSGDGVPSTALVSLLALLAAEPSRMEELKRYWALPVKIPPEMAGERPRP